jgi:predicted nucleic acid-binding protein
MTFSRAQVAVVVDASAAVRFLTGESAWEERWQSWADRGAMLLAPSHFSAEVANALLRSERRPAAVVISDVDRLALSGVESVGDRYPALSEAIELADKHQLTVYDALYLQLALDVEGELATLDLDLRRAASAEGLTVV